MHLSRVKNCMKQMYSLLTYKSTNWYTIFAHPYMKLYNCTEKNLCLGSQRTKMNSDIWWYSHQGHRNVTYNVPFFCTYIKQTYGLVFPAWNLKPVISGMAKMLTLLLHNISLIYRCEWRRSGKLSEHVPDFLVAHRNSQWAFIKVIEDIRAYNDHALRMPTPIFW